MSLYVHRPSVTDPTVAPDGDDTFYVLSPVPHLGHDNGVDWASEADRYKTKMLAVLEDQLLPGVSEHIDTELIFTPETFRDRYLSPHGAGFSIEPRILQSAWFRPHNISEELQGLYLVGAGTHPGAGVPGVISTAEVLDKLVPDPAEVGMIDPKDLDHCREAIRHGSLSFHAASHLLPARVRDPALALYAFCRLADDEVDLKADKAGSVLHLRDRLDLVYAGRPRNAAPDRAFAAVVEEFDMPRALPDALLEGLAWDAEGRRYQTLSGVFDYSARVASSVGAMMCVLMGVRDPDALARACDLGVAMQLTNIARDVGEDALEGRLYLPLDWLAEAGIDPDAFLADPKPRKAIRLLTKRLVMEANRLYYRSEAGIPALPLACRPGIWAARLIYAGIGRQLTQMDYDSISARARTSKVQKIGWLARSAAHSGASLVMPRSAVLFARPLPEVAFLVDSAAHRRPQSRSVALLDTLATLEVDRRSTA